MGQESHRVCDDNLNSLMHTYAQCVAAEFCQRKSYTEMLSGMESNRPFIFFCECRKALEIVYLRHRLSFLFRRKVTRVK